MVLEVFFGKSKPVKRKLLQTAEAKRRRKRYRELNPKKRKPGRPRKSTRAKRIKAPRMMTPLQYYKLRMKHEEKMNECLTQKKMLNPRYSKRNPKSTQCVKYNMNDYLTYTDLYEDFARHANITLGQTNPDIIKSVWLNTAFMKKANGEPNCNRPISLRKLKSELTSNDIPYGDGTNLQNKAKRIQIESDLPNIPPKETLGQVGFFRKLPTTSVAKARPPSSPPSVTSDEASSVTSDDEDDGPFAAVGNIAAGAADAAAGFVSGLFGGEDEPQRDRKPQKLPAPVPQGAEFQSFGAARGKRPSQKSCDEAILAAMKANGFARAKLSVRLNNLGEMDDMLLKIFYASYMHYLAGRAAPNTPMGQYYFAKKYPKFNNSSSAGSGAANQMHPFANPFDTWEKGLDLKLKSVSTMKNIIYKMIMIRGQDPAKKNIRIPVSGDAFKKEKTTIICGIAERAQERLLDLIAPEIEDVVNFFSKEQGNDADTVGAERRMSMLLPFQLKEPSPRMIAAERLRLCRQAGPRNYGPTQVPRRPPYVIRS